VRRGAKAVASRPAAGALSGIALMLAAISLFSINDALGK
jgi:hypothetical protein